jgi:23S rRNA (uracil1939-C5)-methyltransferase
LSALAAKHDLARLTRHGELVVMRRPPVIRVGKAQVTLPPGSFMQPTAAGEETLVRLAIARCKGAKHVADLFSGFGPFALRLAETMKVAAFDSDAEAIAALRGAVKATQGLKPITAEARDLFRRPLVPQELRDYDAVVFDPPRQGAQAQARQFAASRIARVIAVSCNPITFARDARILLDAGFVMDEVTPVDQFRHTTHVEVVARFRR